MYTYSAASLLRNRRGLQDRSIQAKRAREARETQRQFEVSSRKYKCLRIVGKGAYGVVCEAIDRTTRDRSQQKVAIKKIAIEQNFNYFRATLGDVFTCLIERRGMGSAATHALRSTAGRELLDLSQTLYEANRKRCIDGVRERGGQVGCGG